MTTNYRSKPNIEHAFGLYNPAFGNGLEFYKTETERDEAAKKAIKNYLDDNEWSDEVEGVFAFVVTHQATQTNVTCPVGTLDEDGCDETGTYFNDQDSYNCNYELKPLGEIEP